MAYICAKCGSANLKRYYPGTDREEFHCMECRAVDQVEGEDNDEPHRDNPNAVS